MAARGDIEPGALKTYRQVVGRAEDCLRAHPDDRLTVSQLSRLVGRSERGLRQAFARVHGVGPKRWMQTVRLERVHQALAQAKDRSTTVTVVATAHGFYELGRFAAVYRQTFGEPPSATLRAVRCRRLMPPPIACAFKNGSVSR